MTDEQLNERIRQLLIAEDLTEDDRTFLHLDILNLVREERLKKVWIVEDDEYPVYGVFDSEVKAREHINKLKLESFISAREIDIQ